ncbi:hypothetical protein SDC9_117268 [bioreactor metagenome]|uniref:Secretion system C-terminal sorting domain-containing protein n=1 Tax=bioreactor metagenome TaxID=1076179 RepID=A0A645C4N4_9ZZZZ
MKKLLLLVIATIISVNVANATDVLKSNSFEVTNLKNNVSGKYLDYLFDSDHGLAVKFKITNISSKTVNYHASIEKISAGSSHRMMFCIGACSMLKLNGFTNWTSEELSLEPGASTDPENDSYIKIFSGTDESDAVKAIDTLRITYNNLEADQDYVTFLCIWNFNDTFIEVIEDISHKICPNPVSEKLNLTLNNTDEIEIFNISGQKVQNVTVSGLTETDINISNLEKGTYIGYYTKSGVRHSMFKFIKN